MDLDEFLTRHALCRAEITDAFVNRIGDFDNSQEVLVFAGSLVEGVGNNYSDIDLYLFTHRDLSEHFDFTNTLVFTVKNVAVDVEVFSWLYIDELLSRLARYPFDAERNFRETVCFSPGQIKLLHALSIAEFALGDYARYENLVVKDTWSLARILLDRSVANIYVIKSDILGAIQAGDIDVVQYLLSGFFWHIVAIMLSMQGYTNPSEKWRVRHYNTLKQNRDKLLISLMGQYSMLNYFVESDPPNCHDDFFLVFQRLSHIANIVIPYAHFRLMAGVKTGKSSLMLVTPQALAERTVTQSTVMPRLNARVFVCYNNAGFMISKEGQASAHYLNAIAFQFLALFDGETLYNDAIETLRATTGLNTGQVGVQLDHFYNFLNYSKYL